MPEFRRVLGEPGILVVDAAAPAVGPFRFRDVQSAVDAARPGDLVLVRATGDYPGFVLDRGVVVRGETGAFALSSPVIIQDVPAGETAALSHAVFLDSAPSTLTLARCAGNVVVEDVEFQLLEGDNQLSRVLIDQCGAVSLADLVVGELGGLLFVGSTAPAVAISASSVTMTDCRIIGYEGGTSLDSEEPGGDGGVGVQVADGSLLVLARSEVVGGKGGLGWCLDLGFEVQTTPGGRGGDGLQVLGGSTAILLGATSDAVRAGDDDDWCCGFPVPCTGTLGPGDAVLVDAGSSVEVSDVELDGALNVAGSLVREDGVPHLRVTRSLVPAKHVENVVRGAEPGAAVFIVWSNTLGFLPLIDFLGPPQSAVSGDFYQFQLAGFADAGGVQVTEYFVSTLPFWTGLTLHTQCLVQGVSSPDYATNVVSRVIGAR
jgi:hypothetical protein